MITSGKIDVGVGGVGVGEMLSIEQIPFPNSKRSTPEVHEVFQMEEKVLGSNVINCTGILLGSFLVIFADNEENESNLNSCGKNETKKKRKKKNLSLSLFFPSS